MKKCFCLLLVLLLTAGLLAQRQYSLSESEDIQKVLAFQNPAADNTFIIDNIFGSIRVEGTKSKNLQINVQKTIKAKDKERLQKAKEEVALDIIEEGNTIELFVDGPFRDKNKNERRYEDGGPGYEVHYNFDIKIPYRTDLCLKTVTDGRISVQAVEGDFEIKHVNGETELIAVAGSGRAHTVNGKVEASFLKNPAADCSFKTLNGDVRLHFQPALCADFRIKTFTGDAYSDFPVSYLPSKPGTSYREKGKYVYKSDGMTGVRIGSGGPEIKMDTMTGDILIEKYKKN
jgi:hypothetical protein